MEYSLSILAGEGQWEIAVVNVPQAPVSTYFGALSRDIFQKELILGTLETGLFAYNLVPSHS